MMRPGFSKFRGSPAGAFSALVLALACLWPCLARGTASVESLSHGRFSNVQIYRPAGEVRHVALFLSGDAGWNPRLARMATELAADGSLVVGIDLPQLFHSLAADAASCVFPDGDLENLSHYVQAYYKLPTYFTPLLVGYASGASLAYAMIAQAPRGIFAGALSMSFCAAAELRQPLCRGDAVQFAAGKDGGGMRLIPADRLHAPWVVLRASDDAVCPVSAAQSFVSRTRPARFVDLPGAGRAAARGSPWLPRFKAAYSSLVDSERESLPAPPPSLADLPIVEVPAAGKGAASAGDTFAVLLSGDGGWAGLDKQVAAALAAHGIPVAGVDSLRYFWRTRTPAGLSRDLGRTLRYYAFKWHKPRAVLVGYSQGADVLPFALNRLEPDERSLVALTVLMGISPSASFEFHVSHWLGALSRPVPVKPETDKLSAADTLCVYGSDDDDSLCPTVGPTHARVIELSGGHHFGGDYRDLAELIYANLNARP